MNLKALLFILEVYKEIAAIDEVLEALSHKMSTIESFEGKVKVYEQLVNLRNDAFLAKKNICEAFSQFTEGGKYEKE